MLYNIAISLIPGVGDVLAKKLIAYCGGAEAIFKEKKKALLKVPGIGMNSAISIIAKDVLIRAEEEMTFIEKNNISPIFFLSKEYPEKLKYCHDSPIILYQKGNYNLNHKKILSVVGSRKATNYGKSLCNQIIEGFAGENVLIVSGLAYGIDVTAHKSAIKNQLPTIGVLGHGLDMIYPAIHKSISEKMITNGGLLSDYISKTIPDRKNFPSRNRIVAGISDATLVVEAAIKGGALISADIAFSYGRDVFACPGRANDQFSKGCHQLIKTNKAALVETSEDIKYLMNWKEDDNPKNIQKKLFHSFNPEEEIIIEILKENNESSIDYLCFKTEFSISKIAGILLKLELDGVIKSLPGKIYTLE